MLVLYIQASISENLSVLVLVALKIVAVDPCSYIFLTTFYLYKLELSNPKITILILM
jgi:hypothetical protein